MIENFDKERLLAVLDSCYQHAENATEEQLLEMLDPQVAQTVKRCAVTKHAARGAAITFGIYKMVYPQQDIRLHKAEMEGGYSARRIDTAVTVPFLSSKGLPYNVETHWLSQTLSFASAFMPDLELKTVPKTAGSDLVKVANIIENATPKLIEQTVELILYYMIQERNKGNIPITKPKNLDIDQVMELLHKHFAKKYAKNAPRLPQVAVYAIYRCLMKSVDRYKQMELCPLERLKTANRKSGTVGDIDLTRGGRPVEAVEIKFEIPIGISIVAEAIQKIKTASVERYYILSTKPAIAEELQEMYRLKASFRRSNGCEVIINGLYETVKYYLRMLPSTNDFINHYTELLSTVPDLDYEHRVAWNTICEETL